MSVIKRNGVAVDFDKSKIVKAMNKAFIEVKGMLTMNDDNFSKEIAKKVEAINKTRNLSVEEIQDIVVHHLLNYEEPVGIAYVEYRYKRKLVREGTNTTDDTILEIVNNDNEYWMGENSNKNPRLNTTIRDYMAGETSKDISRRLLLPADIVAAHDEGIIHFHDIDYYIQRMHNCCLINLEDMLNNGTVISNTMIEKPHSFSTACNIATQIIAQVASSQYGGQSISLAHLAPFVDVSRQKIRKEVIEERTRNHDSLDESIIEDVVKSRLAKEIDKGVQTIQYQIVTLLTINGQSPFLTVFMYLGEAKNDREKEDLALLIEEVLRQRIQGVKNEEGVWVSPSFPKLIYVLEEDNIHDDSKYIELTRLAMKCSAKRLVPDYISEKIMKKLKKGFCYPVMGCRSALTVYYDEEGNSKFYGRFNSGVVTINLPDVALSSGGDEKKFWEIFEERVELCHKALKCRHERLRGTLADTSPIHWIHGALARLNKGETIDKLLFGGYSTLSLGYAGLYECVKYMTGNSHSDEGVGKEFALKVMHALNDKCAKWREEENIDYSLYGTPIESTTEKFAKALQRRFGIIEGITDKDYVTNSYHIPVFEEIDPFEKLRIEAEFQALSPGGAISYIETADMSDNPEALLEVARFMYDNIMYAEFNTKSDYCQVCGYNKEISLIDDGTGKLIWKCPNCGNTDTDKMDVVRRTCGYLGTVRNGFCQGRLAEFKSRYVHLDDHENKKVNINNKKLKKVI